MTTPEYCVRRIEQVLDTYTGNLDTPGDATELTALTLMEILAVIRGHSGSAFWDQWYKTTIEHAGQRMPLNRYFGQDAQGRDKLVQVLREHLLKYQTPPPQGKPSPKGGDEPMDPFDLFEGMGAG